jgi:hypothetical protein
VGVHRQRRWHSLFRRPLPDRVCGENWGRKARAMLFAATPRTTSADFRFCGRAESRRRVEILVQPAPSRVICRSPATAASGTRKAGYWSGRRRSQTRHRVAPFCLIFETSFAFDSLCLYLWGTRLPREPGLANCTGPVSFLAIARNMPVTRGPKLCDSSESWRLCVCPTGACVCWRLSRDKQWKSLSHCLRHGLLHGGNSNARVSKRE